jgi:N-acylneuraminate cytidylyltransferase/CMP-N,N'-diacetyllegionaminic acid synthase
MTGPRICTILARGGSKGLPGKNLRPLGGRPLIAHAIEQASEAGVFDAIAVSSDSDDILAVAREWGVEYVIRRPDEMATDGSSKLPAIQHCATSVEAETGVLYETVTDIGVTSPLRSAEDIKGAVAMQQEHGNSIVVSAAEARSTPYFNIVERDHEGFAHLCNPPPGTIQRRQDGPECFELNGAIYVWRRDALMNDPKVFYPDTLIYEMPVERSVDVDAAIDLAFAEFLIGRNL